MANSYQWDSGILLSLPVFKKTAAEYQLLLDAGDMDKVEDLLMERLDASPQDLAFYFPAYRACVRRQEFDRATTLLQLHADCLKSRGDQTLEIHLWAAILDFWPDCVVAREALLNHVKTLYANCPGFERFVTHFKVLEAAEGVAALRTLELWLRYDEGQAVYMPSKGVGRVRAVRSDIARVKTVLREQELAADLTNTEAVSYTINGTLAGGIRGRNPSGSSIAYILRVGSDGAPSHLIWAQTNDQITDSRVIDTLATLAFRSVN